MRGAWSAALYPQGDAFRAGGGTLRPDPGALTMLADELDGLVTLALGIGRGDWAALANEDALRRWVTDGEAIGQRMLREVYGQGYADLGRSDIGLLPAVPGGAIAPRLAGDAADAFVAAPTWEGAPRETGALQRRAGGPLVGALLRRHGNGVLTRQVARLDELAATVDHLQRLLGEVVPSGPGGIEDPISGSGTALVEAARGRLVHRVDLVDGRIADYRILAPTEWNFHPKGALAAGLLTLPVDERLQRLAQLLIDAVDPCVESRVEVAEATGHA
jgi:hypothetical protein